MVAHYRPWGTWQPLPLPRTLHVYLRAASWSPRSHYCKTFSLAQPASTRRHNCVNSGKEDTFSMWGQMLRNRSLWMKMQVSWNPGKRMPKHFSAWELSKLRSFPDTISGMSRVFLRFIWLIKLASSVWYLEFLSPLWDSSLNWEFGKPYIWETLCVLRWTLLSLIFKLISHLKYFTKKEKNDRKTRSKYLLRLSM